jgi:hypothetical protein
MARNPIPELTTSRVRLRAFRPEDASAFPVACGDAETMRYCDHDPSPTIARTGLYLSHWSKPPADGHMVGAVWLQPRSGPDA